MNAVTQTQLPIIDMNSMVPTLKSKTVALTEKPESFDMTSVDLAENLIQAVMSGAINPLDFAVKGKLLKDAIELARKDPRIKDLTITEINKFGKEGATALGAKIKITKRINLKYAADPTWYAINETEMKPVKEKLEAQQLRIKSAVANGHAVVDSDSGEVLAEIVPAPQTESITVSFSKK